MAQYLDKLALDGDLAEQMSLVSREKAQLWRWSSVMKEWTGYYANLLNKQPK